MGREVADVSNCVDGPCKIRRQFAGVDNLLYLVRQIARSHLTLIPEKILEASPAECSRRLRAVRQNEAGLLVVPCEFCGNLCRAGWPGASLGSYQAVRSGLLYAVELAPSAGIYRVKGLPTFQIQDQPMACRARVTHDGPVAIHILADEE